MSSRTVIDTRGRSWTVEAPEHPTTCDRALCMNLAAVIATPAMGRDQAFCERHAPEWMQAQEVQHVG